MYFKHTYRCAHAIKVSEIKTYVDEVYINNT